MNVEPPDDPPGADAPESRSESRVQMTLDEALTVAQGVDEQTLRQAVEVIRSEELDRQEAEYREFSSGPDYARLLTNVGQAFLQREEFVPGQLVRWKRHLKNRQRPVYDAPAIVIEVLATPVTIDPEPNDVNVAERLDLRLGVLINDNRFAVYHFDSRRFEPFETR